MAEQKKPERFSHDKAIEQAIGLSVECKQNAVSCTAREKYFQEAWDLSHGSSHLLGGPARETMEMLFRHSADTSTP